LKGSKVPDTLADVCRIMMIRFDDARSVELHDDVSVQKSVHVRLYSTNRNQLCAVFSK
jgi:hypothetical protein